MVRKRKRNGCLASLLVLLIGGAMGSFAGWNWLQDHPQHNPMAPLDLRDPIGMATAYKLNALRENVPECRAVLDRSGVSYTALSETGEGACARPDRTQLDNFPFSPNTPAVTCPVAAGMQLWREKSVAPAAIEHLGSELVRIEHMGAFNCRRMRGSGSNAWSQHSTANAIDISAFVLADGRRISLLDDWDGDSDRAQFLRAVRDDACEIFSTVLSPDFNAAHADHFHFDQGNNYVGICR